jgi:hypothetical protein
MVEIVKVQRPISDPNGPLLVYAKGHANMKTMDRFPARVWIAMEADVKAYFEAEWSPEGSPEGWKIGKRVENQDW